MLDGYLALDGTYNTLLHIVSLCYTLLQHFVLDGYLALDGTYNTQLISSSSSTRLDHQHYQHYSLCTVVDKDMS